MTDLTLLLERLSAATGPDRELDAAIWLFIGGPGFEHRARYPHHAPEYTGTIEEALELVPPGFAWKVGTCCVSDDAWVAPDFNSPEHGDRLRKEIGEIAPGSMWDEGFDVDQRPPGRVAIALCIACLRAHAALQELPAR